MSFSEVYQVIQLVATLVAICAGIVGLYKYFENKRTIELREWQKVVVYKLLRGKETESFTFPQMLEKYRIESQAFRDVNLTKKEISEDAYSEFY